MKKDAIIVIEAAVNGVIVYERVPKDMCCGPSHVFTGLYDLTDFIQGHFAVFIENDTE